MLKRFDIRINHDMGECLYTVEAKGSKSAIETVEKEWHKDHKGYTGTTPKFTVQKTYTHAEKKSLGGLLLALIGGVYLYKVYTNKKTTAKGKASLENYRSESTKYKQPSSRRKAKDSDDMFQAEEARMSNRKKSKDVKDIYDRGGAIKELQPYFDEGIYRNEFVKENSVDFALKSLQNFHNLQTAIEQAKNGIKLNYFEFEKMPFHNFVKKYEYIFKENYRYSHPEIKETIDSEIKQLEADGYTVITKTYIFTKGKFTPKNNKAINIFAYKLKKPSEYAKGGNVNEGIPQPIIDMFDESYVFLKEKYPHYENMPLIQDTEEFWDMVEDVRENFDTDTPTNYGEIGEELVRNYLYGHEKRFEETEYAKGGTLQENLEKELHKLRRDLSSNRLLDYKQGDTSETEMARQRERDSKMKRMDEVLQLLNQITTKYAKGGNVKFVNRDYSASSATIHWDDWVKLTKNVLKPEDIVLADDWIKVKHAWQTRPKDISEYGADKGSFMYSPSLGKLRAETIDEFYGSKSNIGYGKYAEGGRAPRAWGYPPKMTNKEIVDYLKDYNYAVVEPLDYLAGFMDKVFFISYGRKMGYLTDWQKTKEECMYHFENLQMGASEGGFKLQAKIIKLTPEVINDILLQTNYMYTTYKTGGSIDTIEFADGGQVQGSSFDIEYRDDEGDTYDESFDTLEEARAEMKRLQGVGYKITETWKYVNNTFVGRFAKGGGVGFHNADDAFDFWENQENQQLSDDQRVLWIEGYEYAKAHPEHNDFNFYEWEESVYGNESVLSDDDRVVWQSGFTFFINYINTFATGGGVGSGIKVGDWVTLKSDKKRYKVKRVLSNNMIEITAGAKTLTVNISDVETNVKFFRSKFVPVPTNIEVKFKIGDRLKFNTKKGITEVGKVLLYKYVPTQNTIIYTIATDSGWKASVLQDNLSKEYTSFTIPANNTPSPAPVKNTPPRTTFSIPSIEVGDKIEIIGSPNLTGTVTKVLSSTSEAEVLLSDSTGMTIKKGKSVPFTFSGSKIKKV